jgi:hypothetical protein
MLRKQDLSGNNPLANPLAPDGIRFYTSTVDRLSNSLHAAAPEEHPQLSFQDIQRRLKVVTAIIEAQSKKKREPKTLENLIKSRASSSETALERATELLVDHLQKCSASNKNLFRRLAGAVRRSQQWSDEDLEFLRTLLRSGTLDAIWYQERYADIKASTFSSVEHFLRFGADEGRAPSGETSAQLVYERIELVGKDAISSWLDDSAKLTSVTPGNPDWLIYANRRRNQESMFSPMRFDEIGLRVALCAHIFYSDLLAEVGLLLADAQNWGIDIFASVSSPEMALGLESMLNPELSRVTVVVVPNRGRNFAPLLIEFAAELQNYDFFGHIHGKRSKHMSENSSGSWRKQLFELFNFKNGCPISLFKLIVDTELGVTAVYDETSLPYWSNHWLSNSPIESKDEKDRLGFLRYPVGGMFWCRPIVIAPLLARKWTYSDFPEELGQLDGTIQHSIEREIGAMSERVGLKVGVDTRSGQPINDLVKDQYLHQISPREIRESLKLGHSVSVDFFDTLVARKSGDTQYARSVAFKKVFGEKSGDLNRYKEIRNTVESELFGNTFGQKIESILQATMSRIDSPDLAELVLLNELDAERSDLYLRPGMQELIETLMGRFGTITLISDTYYPTEFVQTVLRDLLPSWSKSIKVRCSCDTGERKDWNFNWTRFVEGGGSHIHFGDNVKSDVQIPTGQGVKSIHVGHFEDLYWMKRGIYPWDDGSYYLRDAQLADCGDPWLGSIDPDEIRQIF